MAATVGPARTFPVHPGLILDASRPRCGERRVCPRPPRREEPDTRPPVAPDRCSKAGGRATAGACLAAARCARMLPGRRRRRAMDQPAPLDARLEARRRGGRSGARGAPAGGRGGAPAPGARPAGRTRRCCSGASSPTCPARSSPASRPRRWRRPRPASSPSPASARRARPSCGCCRRGRGAARTRSSRSSPTTCPSWWTARSAALARQGRVVRQLLHPIVAVRRDGAGRLLSLGGPAAERRTPPPRVRA